MSDQERNAKRGIEIVDMLELEGFSYADGTHILAVAKNELSKRIDDESNIGRKEIRIREKDDWIEKWDKKIIQWLWIIFVSMITALITTLVYTA